MHVIVLCYFRTRNTYKLATAVREGLESVDGVTCLLPSTDGVSKEDFIESGGIISESPVYFGTMAAELKKGFDDVVGAWRRIEKKVGTAFATGVDASGGKQPTMMSIIQTIWIYGRVIVGDPTTATGHCGVACQGASSCWCQGR